MTMPTDQTLPPPASLDADADADAGATAQRQLSLLAARARHWQRTRSLTALLLALWLAATFCTVFFARELAQLSLFGWPLSFYLAAQGAALIYLAILGAYALALRRFDRRYQSELDQARPGEAA
jgi:putative solute:sodium symporter small subunit